MPPPWADVSDLCEWKAKDQGGFYEQSEAAARDGKRWLALPYGIVGNRWRTGNRGSPPWSGTRMIGYAGPANAKAGEVYSKYVIADMFAKGVQGMKAEDAVKWAEGELKRVYES